MEAVLAKIRYSHAKKDPNTFISEHIQVPTGEVVTVQLKRDFTIELDHSSTPICRWKSPKNNGSSKDGWQNEQFSSKWGGLTKVLTVYRDAVETQHADH